MAEQLNAIQRLIESERLKAGRAHEAGTEQREGAVQEPLRLSWLCAAPTPPLLLFPRRRRLLCECPPKPPKRCCFHVSVDALAIGMPLSPSAYVLGAARWGRAVQ